MVGISASSYAQEADQTLRQIAAQIQERTSSIDSMKKVHQKLASLSPSDAHKVAKHMRNIAVSNGTVSNDYAKAFPVLEAFEERSAELSKALFGSEKTVWNMTPDELTFFTESLENDPLAKDLLQKADTIINNDSKKMKAASGCYYDPNWSGKLERTTNTKSGNKAGSSGRVKNSPDETCDFVLYIKKGYTKVYGTVLAMQSCVLTWDNLNGLSASPSKDAVIVGFGRVAACTAGLGLSEWYVKNYLRFK